MKPFLEFLMTAEEVSRAKVLANIPWTNCFVPSDVPSRDAMDVWHSVSCFVVQKKHAIASTWRELGNYEGIARITLYEEINLKFFESSNKSSVDTVSSSVRSLFENMPDVQGFLNNKKECFVINQKMEGSIALDGQGREMIAYYDSAILFKYKENQLLFLNDDMPMWVKITSNKVIIDEILATCHCLKML